MSNSRAFYGSPSTYIDYHVIFMVIFQAIKMRMWCFRLSKCALHRAISSFTYTLSSCRWAALPLSISQKWVFYHGKRIIHWKLHRFPWESFTQQLQHIQFSDFDCISRSVGWFVGMARLCLGLSRAKQRTNEFSY